MSVDDFDPNKIESGMPPAATYILGCGNRPAFKTHKSVALARRAIKYHGRGKLYEWEDNKWVERMALNPKWTENICEKCGEGKIIPKGKDNWGYPKRPKFATWTMWDKNDPFKLHFFHYDCKPVGMY